MSRAKYKLNHIIKAAKVVASSVALSRVILATVMATINCVGTPAHAQTAVESSAPMPKIDSLDADQRFKWSGDVRLRTQKEDVDDRESRLFERLRARVKVDISIEPGLTAAIRLATSRGNRSTNITLGSNDEPAGRRRAMGLDLAFGQWQPITPWKFYVGRHPQLQVRVGDSQILLDQELNLEGLASTVEIPVFENQLVFASAGTDMIRENYDTDSLIDETDNTLNWAQAGWSTKNSDTRIRIGVGFYNFVDVRGRNFTDFSKDADAFGNSQKPLGKIRYRYLSRQIFTDLEVKTTFGDFTLFFDGLKNPEAPDRNEAAWTGLRYSSSSLEAQVAYGEVGADSVLNMYTSSAFAGGKTDSRGWAFSAKWSFNKNFSLKILQYLNRVSLVTNPALDSRSASGFNLTQIDAMGTF